MDENIIDKIFNKEENKDIMNKVRIRIKKHIENEKGNTNKICIKRDRHKTSGDTKTEE